MELTKENIQNEIDRFNDLATAYKEEGFITKSWYYKGRADTWVIIYRDLYPGMNGERAFPRSNEEREQRIKILKGEVWGNYEEK